MGPCQKISCYCSKVILERKQKEAKMSKKVLVAILLGVLVIAAGVVVFYSWNSGIGKGQVIEKKPDGEINWTEGYVQAIGRAVPPDNVTTPAQGKEMARRGAIVDAQRRLIEIIKGVRIEGRTTMVNAMANDVVRQVVEGRVTGAELVPRSEKWDGQTYEVALRVNLLKDISSLICKPDVLGDSGLPICDPDTFKPHENPVRQSSYTGLIIDATGINLTPQVLFSIYDETGKLIYGAAKAFYQAVADRGLAKYWGALNSAKGDPRVGNKPLIVKAKAAGGDFNTDIIVSVEDGQKMINELDGTDVFAEAKVIVVMD